MPLAPHLKQFQLLLVALGFLTMTGFFSAHALHTPGVMTPTLTMRTQAVFDDYAIAPWGVPAPFSHDRSRIETNAKEVPLAKNTDDEFDRVLLFDLRPDVELRVSIREPCSHRSGPESGGRSAAGGRCGAVFFGPFFEVHVAPPGLPSCSAK